jgi:hypothetical protein
MAAARVQNAGATQLTDGTHSPLSDADLIRRIAVRQDIEQVIYRYCRGVDRADWEMMRSVFHDDARDNHGTVDGTPDDLVEWTRRRHQNVLQSMHSVTNIGFLVEEADFARVETYCTVHQTHRREGKPPAHLSIGCRYVDEFSFRGEWRISARDVRYEWVHRLAPERDLLPTSADLTPSPRDRSDPIYREGSR